MKENTTYIPVDLKRPVHKRITNYVRADITKKLPFKSSYCELVCLFQVLEYLSSPTTVFSEAHRILKKGGFFVLSTPFLYPIHDAPYDKVRYTKQALLEFLKNAGFKKVEIQPESTGFAFLANSVNMFLLRALYHRIKKGGVSKGLSLFAIPFVLSLCTAVNGFAYLLEHIFPAASHEFPLNYTVIARK